MKAAIYARVSTKPRAECPHCSKSVRLVENRFLEHANRDDAHCDGSGVLVEVAADKGQDTENQLSELREYCKRQNWNVVEFIDRETGKHGNRAAFQQMFAAAAQRRFDLVVVWALDRFTREGVLETFDYIRKLNEHGVAFESFTEQMFRTSGMAGELLIAIFAWIAKQERLRISERTKAGLARARREGKHCGRPARVFRRDQAQRMRRDGLSFRNIAQALNVPLATVVDAITGRRRRSESPKAA